MRKILIINIFGIGDVLFTTPLVRSLRENFPGAYIAYVCSQRAYSVLEHNPHLDKIYIYEKDDYRALWKKSRVQAIQKAIAALAEIRSQQFDVVVDLSLNRLFNFLSWAFGVPERIGFNYKNRSPFLTKKVPIKGFEDKHVVEHYLSLLQFFRVKPRSQKMEVFSTAADQSWAEGALRQNGIKPGERVVALIPGGGVSWGKDVVFRRWPVERHAQLVDKIIAKFKVKVILLGDLSEQPLATELRSTMKNSVIDFIGQTSVGQYLAFFSRCELVVLNDGGPLHMAVAAGARTVSLIGPVDEKIYGPYPPQGHGIVTQNIACRPCYRSFRHADCEHISCLRQITVEDVFEKVEEILKEKI